MIFMDFGKITAHGRLRNGTWAGGRMTGVFNLERFGKIKNFDQTFKSPNVYMWARDKLVSTQLNCLFFLVLSDRYW